MENFTFVNPTKIVFGRNTHQEIGALVKQHSKKILLHYEGNGELIQKLGIYKTVLESLDKEGIEYKCLGGVVPNPQVNLVYEGIEICKKEGIDFILAIGGGSVIDSSKAIALGSVYDDDVWNFFTGKDTPKSSLKVGVILTIPGAGSEMSESSIISNEALGLKSVCDSEYNFPVFSILDPQVCFSVPKHIMAAGVADIMSHLMERYFTKTIHIELSDALLESAMRTVVKFGKKILDTPQDYNVCSQIMWAATVAHNGMIAAGRVADWSSHRIEHEISALYGITHGDGMAVIFPAWMKYVRLKNISRLAQFSRNVFFETMYTEEESSLAGIHHLEIFFKTLGLKNRLLNFNIGSENFETMAEKALCGNTTLGRFQALTKEDIVNILELAK